MTKLARRLTLLVSLTLVLAATACPSDPVVTKDQFPVEMAQSVCRWYFGCCDIGEREAFNMQATTESACVNELATSYALLFQQADPRVWDGKAALQCMEDMDLKANQCPKAVDPTAHLASCKMIVGSVPVGSRCNTQWDCVSKYCFMGASGTGICANPLGAGEDCTSGEPCQAGLSCVRGKCQGLQPDNASCVASQECFSGFCGGGQCQPNQSGFYGCDGKNL